jgi:hypothetical protein
VRRLPCQPPPWNSPASISCTFSAPRPACREVAGKKGRMWRGWVVSVVLRSGVTWGGVTLTLGVMFLLTQPDSTVLR